MNIEPTVAAVVGSTLTIMVAQAAAGPVLDDDALATLGAAPLGLYLHVPYCAAICGYCDFNTYVAVPGDAGPRGHVDALLAELAYARTVLGDEVRPVQTVFIGGGTPTLLGGVELVRLLRGVKQTIGLAADAEITTEANPETVDEQLLTILRDGGFTRISLGMQSASPHVLAKLERRHTPGRAVAAARTARAVGFEHVSLDLIYGTPGESDDDWCRSLEAAIAADVDHVSAYALTIEPGTRMGAAVGRGEIAPTDDDLLAARYEQTEALLSAAGFDWYEISNWARGERAHCAHNDVYWTDGNWWGAGPGAHSHIGGVRWWNRRHPGGWSQAVSAGLSPAAGYERLDPTQRRLEYLMLGIRRRQGLQIENDPALMAVARQLVTDGLLEQAALDDRSCSRAVLTLRGRLLANAVTLALAEA